MNPGTVYWVTGLAGAGKTTIARGLYERLRRGREAVVLLDGDALREVYGNDLGHTLEDRRRVAGRNSRLCRMLASQGIDVVCATISMFHECRRWNREHIASYREIFVSVPMDVLHARDQRGLYSGVRNGTNTHVLGLDIEPEFPETPDVTLVNDGTRPPEVVVDECMHALGLAASR